MSQLMTLVDDEIALNLEIQTLERIKTVINSDINLAIKKLESEFPFVLDIKSTLSVDKTSNKEVDSDLLKSTIREIRSKCHPDLVGNDSLSEVFINATKLFKNGDLDSLLIINNLLTSSVNKNDIKLLLLKHKTIELRKELDDLRRLDIYKISNLLKSSEYVNQIDARMLYLQIIKSALTNKS